MFEAVLLAEVIGTIIYTALGLGLLWVIWKVVEMVAPFPIVKEIEQDQNVALAVLIASLFLSASIIIAAVILS